MGGDADEVVAEIAGESASKSERREPLGEVLAEASSMLTPAIAQETMNIAKFLDLYRGVI